MNGVRLDLHVHSHHSPDSPLTVEEIVFGLRAANLNGFALTDHNTVAGNAELAGWQARFPELVLVPGVEVSTVEGHLLAYGVMEAPPPERPVLETIDWVRAHGGVSVLAHSFRSSHGVGRAVSETARVDAIEVINGHNSPRANRRAARVGALRSLPTTGGSDVHELSDLGRAYTEFPPGTRGAAMVLAAIREGKTAAGGSSLGFAGRLRVEWRSAFLRIRRGFRPI
jgi:predicted metal-dependent phosphoesterase TrpH